MKEKRTFELYGQDFIQAVANYINVNSNDISINIVSDNNSSNMSYKMEVTVNEKETFKPVAEVVPIVRCKDCMFNHIMDDAWYDDGTPMHFCAHERGLPGAIKYDNFCNYGARK